MLRLPPALLIFLLLAGCLPLGCRTASSAAPTVPHPKLEDLQGAWCSDSATPTADFGIEGGRVWLDAEAGLNPCRLAGDTLVFDLDGGGRQVRNRILRLAGD